ncbi:unnamed protein product [Pseudo-nitzschia multistriata]|uniref:Pentapeptide repeat-containing protein n=1 Tax=Pseudo-nitzschia multistriata TaxID=183589 RepID=A0A448Z030_9STRA|nr:unnamed protein product [Pseudo-nitzschia multistriata]
MKGHRFSRTTLALVLAFVALAATAARAFAPSTRSRARGAATELNSMWRNWIPRTSGFLDVAVGERRGASASGNRFPEKDPSPGDPSPGRDPKSVSLVSERPASQLPTPGFLPSATAAVLALSLVFSAPALAVSGGGLDFAGLDISNQDFSNQNFKGKDFTQVLARNTNFAGSNFVGCRFPKAYLINANYEGADLRGVSFEGTNMEGVNLKNANVAGAYFGATIIDAGSIENADFTDAQFPPKTLALMCDRPDMKGTNPATGADTRDSAMCP